MYVCTSKLLYLQVIRQLSNPMIVKKVLQYFVPARINEVPEYAKKVKAMMPFLNKKNVSIDDLPADLAYHLELVKTLAGKLMIFFSYLL